MDLNNRLNAMTVDVEDYFQVSAFESVIEKKDWNSMSLRVGDNTNRLLDLFAKNNVKSTFFTLGWVAERFPARGKRIVSEGHEIASHGWEHIRVTEQTPVAFRQDIIQTKQLLEDISGQEIKGYRAASYSINASNLWAQDELADAGYRYSSSIVPIKHDLYGMPDAPRFAFGAADGRLLEIPVSTVPIAGRNINCGGGGWFRLFPYAFSRWALQRVNNRDGEAANFYFHPWEIDADQPKFSSAPWKSKARHYINLSRMEGKVEKLLKDFNWVTMQQAYEIK